MTSIYTVLGTNIRKLRKVMGWSQAVLAEKADIAVSYMTMIELGQRSASLEVIQIIARVFGVSVASLFEEAETLVVKDDSDRIGNFEKKLMEKIHRAVSDCVRDLKSDILCPPQPEKD